MSEGGSPGGSDDFFALLDELRIFRDEALGENPSLRAMARAAKKSPTTIGDWLRGKRFPEEIGAVLAIVRMVREEASRSAILGSEQTRLLDDDRWRSAYRREARRRAFVVSDGVEQSQAVWALAGPRVQVGKANLRMLGVHAAISVTGVPDDPLPEYVPRDIDTADNGLRAKVEAAAQHGGFVLLIGGSSVGKTRTAAEIVKALLPHWWLVHPPGPAEVAVLAEAPPPRAVVWLDELQRYLDGDQGLTGGVVRALLSASQPVVIIGTLSPLLYDTYTRGPTSLGARLHEREREVLELADLVRIDPVFSEAEEERARAAAPRDMRLAVALDTPGWGLTQTLAAAPQLIARWQDAQTDAPYARAVLATALDAARLGARAPLSAGLLRAAAPGYCTSQQQAVAPHNWFEQAVAYATHELLGAARALAPVGAGMRQTAGYLAADYLTQNVHAERIHQLGPASLWDALADLNTQPGDLARLGYAAAARGLYRHAARLWTAAISRGAGPGTANELMVFLHWIGIDDANACAQWVTARVPMDNAYDIRQLIHALPPQSKALQVLARRAAAEVPLGNPLGVSLLLGALEVTGQTEAAAALAHRAPGTVPIAGALEQTAWGAGPILLYDLRPHSPSGPFGRDSGESTGLDVSALAMATAHERANMLARVKVDNPDWIRRVIVELATGGLEEAAEEVAARAAARTSLAEPEAVAWLLEELNPAGKGPDATEWEAVLNGGRVVVPGGKRAFDVLARRAAAHIALDDYSGVATLLLTLDMAHCDEALRTLIERQPARHFHIDPAKARESVSGFARLALTLQQLGRPDLKAERRAADAGAYQAVGWGKRYPFGREPDGTASPRWEWRPPDGRSTS